MANINILNGGTRATFSLFSPQSWVGIIADSTLLCHSEVKASEKEMCVFIYVNKLWARSVNTENFSIS